MFKKHISLYSVSLYEQKSQSAVFMFPKKASLQLSSEESVDDVMSFTSTEFFVASEIALNFS